MGIYKTRQKMAEDIIVELQELSNQVNEAINYINEYKRQSLKANNTDMMLLYKVIAKYEKKINDYYKHVSEKVETNDNAKIIDLMARLEDAKDNKRIIGEIIACSMDEIKIDAEAFKNKLADIVSDKDKVKDKIEDNVKKSSLALLEALAGYENAMKTDKTLEKADSKEKLAEACINYIKDEKNNPEALNIVFEIAKILGKQNKNAFSNLKEEQLQLLVARKHTGYASKPTENSLKLDDPISSKEKFIKRQNVIRQWFLDEVELVSETSIRRNIAKNYFNILNNRTYNGFFRSFMNSDEYNDLLNALENYSREASGSKKNQNAFEKVKLACKNYLKYYEGKKDKSSFAIMRKDKVIEFLVKTSDGDKANMIF